MREIKFRKWDFEEGEMIPGDALAFEEYAPLTKLLTQRGIMQYTGATDRNGREIYEGDFILDHNTDTKFLVKYDNDQAGFYLDIGIGKGSGAFIVGDLEIIGNIYEDPDRLEAGE